MPQQNTTVQELVSMVARGELRLPAIQRRYVWPATRVRDLLDSLYRGYPSGSILVWETDSDIPGRDLAVEQGKNVYATHKMLLDGQQRITSLAATIQGKPVEVRRKGKLRPIEILFNLDHPDGPPRDALEVEEEESEETEEEEPEESVSESLKNYTFVVEYRGLKNNPQWVPVSKIFRNDVSDVDILKPLVNGLDDPNFVKYSRRLQNVRKIKDYTYVVQLLDRSLDYREVTEIFVRVNSLGVKLRGSDLASALITSRWPESQKLFEDFQDECDRAWSYLETGLLVRALVARTTGQSRFDTVPRISTDKLREGWRTTREGFEYAINFLRANAGVEHVSLLSSPFFLITLGEYWNRNKGKPITAETEAAFRRWLFLASGRGHYSRGSSETILDADLRAIRNGGGPKELLELLKQQLGRLDVEAADLAGKGQRSALFSLAFLALRTKGAREWETNLQIAMGHQGREHWIQYHHIFPKSLLREEGIEREAINEVANMAFVAGGSNRRMGNKPAEETLKRLMEKQGVDAFKAHCLPAEPSLWKMENYTRFLEYRRTALAKAINEFINQVASARPEDELKDLLAAGEGPGIELKETFRWDTRQNQVNPELEWAVVKTIAGFLNSYGGNLLIGVDDNGDVVGLDRDFASLTKRPNLDGFQQALSQSLLNAIGAGPMGSVQVEFPKVDGKVAARLRVGKSSQPIFAKAKNGEQRFYARFGSATRELAGQDLISYRDTHWPK